MLGDAMNMRHPLTGGGMTVAFNDVVLLRDLLSPETVPDFGNTKLVLEQMERFHWQRKNLTSVINILAQALYSLFAASGMSPCPQYYLNGKLTIYNRPPTQSPPIRLLPLFPTRRPMCRWSRRSLSRHHSSASRFILSLFLRRSACDMAGSIAVALV